MTPTTFQGVDVVLGAPTNWDSETHGPCDGLPIMRRDGVCISRWSLSWRERFAVLFRGVVWCHVASGDTQPPISLTVEG